MKEPFYLICNFFTNLWNFSVYFGVSILLLMLNNHLVEAHFYGVFDSTSKYTMMFPLWRHQRKQALIVGLTFAFL